MHNKSRSLQWPLAQVLIQADTSAKGWGGGGGGGALAGSGNLEWYINRWNVVSPGNETPHQYSRIISSKASHTGIHKMEDVNTSSSGQHCCLNIFDENGGYSKSENGRVGQDNLEISFELRNHKYCRIPPNQIQCNNRQGISKHCMFSSCHVRISE